MGCGSGMLGAMLVVHGTKKFRNRAGGSTDSPGEPLTPLGRWYATVSSWRPRQLALFVHDPTLLPVLMPLAGRTLVGLHAAAGEPDRQQVEDEHPYHERGALPQPCPSEQQGQERQRCSPRLKRRRRWRPPPHSLSRSPSAPLGPSRSNDPLASPALRHGASLGPERRHHSAIRKVR